jgi:hypothetical protein
MKHTENCWTIQNRGERVGREVEGFALIQALFTYRWNIKAKQHWTMSKHLDNGQKHGRGHVLKRGLAEGEG